MRDPRTRVAAALFTILVLSAAHPVPATARFDWIEARCAGGIAGRVTTVRVTRDGVVTRSDELPPIMRPVGRIPAADARALSARLDAAGFNRLATRPERHRIVDGIGCALQRSGSVVHKVGFNPGADDASGAVARRETAVRTVLDQVLGAPDRVTLNPQPIPPG